MFEIYIIADGNKLPEISLYTATSSVIFVVSSFPDLIGCNNKNPEIFTGWYSVQLNK